MIQDRPDIIPPILSSRLENNSNEINSFSENEEIQKSSEPLYSNSLWVNAPMPQWFITVEGHYLGGNKAFLKATGYTLQELKDAPPFHPIYPKDRASFRRWLEKLSRCQKALTHRYRILLKNGTYQWVKARAQSYFSPDKKVMGILGSDVFFSKSKKSQHTVQSLLALNEKKERFIAEWAHEMRGPLTVLINTLQLVQSSDFKDRVDWAYAMMVNQLEILSHLAEDLVRMSHIQGELTFGGQLLTQKLLDIGEVLDKSLGVTGIFFSRKKQTVHSHYRGNLYVKGDPHRLQQIFTNLLSNAHKYGKEGGEIHLSAEKKQNEIIVTVRDNGQGIPKACLSQIFQPFYQVPSVKGKKTINEAKIKQYPGIFQKGLGVGLAIAMAIVKAHKGAIRVKSDGPNRGTTFTVSLPIAKAEFCPWPREEKWITKTSSHPRFSH